MTAKLTAEMTSPGSGFAACPHVIFRNVFGLGMVAGLLDYVAGRQAEFKPALVRSRATGEGRADRSLRSSVSLADLGAFKAPFKAFVAGIACSALTRLNAAEPAVEPKDFEISAFRDGDRFGAHIDTDERLTRVRVLSCVYYFAATPRRFSGGELRLYGLPTVSAAKGGPAPFIDVVPETDSMVLFSSWLRHEVMPVAVPSGAWPDSRFTINCWLHRVPPSTASGRQAAT